MSPNSSGDYSLEPDGQGQKSKRKRWWRQEGQAVSNFVAPKKGESCPKCLMDDLDYDTLFRLSCPVCGYVAECGAFT